MAKKEIQPDELIDSEVLSDASLLRRFQVGDQSAATEMFHRYAGRLLRLAEANTASDVAVRNDADDIVQSVFRTFFRRAAIGEYELPAGDVLWKLFLVIGLNKVRAVAAHNRAAKRDVRKTIAGLATDGPMMDAVQNDDTSLIVLQETIEEILAPLKLDQREMIELRIAGYEIAEIATRTQRAKRSVERILQEFRAKLQQQISATDDP